MADNRLRFLLAQLQMDSVAKKNSRRDIRRSLASLPQKLDDTYDEAMRRIWSQGREDIELAQRLLPWIICAKRPLKLIEVQHALTVEVGDADLDEEGIPEAELMISACAGLVTVDSESTTIRLVHYTAQEYFERIMATQFPRAQVDITSTCLTYLSFKNIGEKSYRTDLFEEGLERYPLAMYAAQFWGEHAKGDPEVALEGIITSFLKDGARVAFCNRISIYLRQGYENTTESSSAVTGLHIAAWFGLKRIVATLLSSSDMDINVRDPAGETPLHWAARNCQAEVVEELLTHSNIIADASNLRGRTPLSLAAESGHAVVVALLLERKDVDANGKDTFHLKSPLWRAIDGRHENVARMLLAQPSVDVNSPGTARGQTPLWRAASNGDARMVQLLCEQPGVDVNAPDIICNSTPLSEAQAQGHSAVVELLLAHPDINVDTDSASKHDAAYAALAGSGTMSVYIDE
jgi:ankyrin repeat protein